MSQKRNYNPVTPSNDAISWNWDSNTFLTRLYWSYMQLEPDACGTTYWIGELNSRIDRVPVKNSFADSTEFAGIFLEFWGIVTRVHRAAEIKRRGERML